MRVAEPDELDIRIERLRGDSELREYMRGFQSYPTLDDHETFLALFHTYREGKGPEREHAKQLLIGGNIRLVVSVALKRRQSGFGLTDLVQEGSIGLLTALDRYDPTYGTRFSTYAVWWIRVAMDDAIGETPTFRPYRLPTHLADRVLLVKRALETCIQNRNPWPTPEELLKQVRKHPTKSARTTTLEQVCDALEYACVSSRPLQSPLGEDGDRTFADVIGDERENIEVTIEARQQYRRLMARIQKVCEYVESRPEREATILRQRLWMHDDPQRMTLRELGDRLGFTRERIRQIELTEVRKLERLLGMTARQIRMMLRTGEELAKLSMGTGSASPSDGRIP